jgi:hypothetical protein
MVIASTGKIHKFMGAIPIGTTGLMGNILLEFRPAETTGKYSCNPSCFFYLGKFRNTNLLC